MHPRRIARPAHWLMARRYFIYFVAASAATKLVTDPRIVALVTGN